MPRIQVCSDAHVEFHADGGRTFADFLTPNEKPDVLVVAGDLAPVRTLPEMLIRLAERYPHIVYVPGNHEYYGAAPGEAETARREAAERCNNVTWLEEGTVMVAGVRFVGTPLWFRDDPLGAAHRSDLNDFAMIHDFVPWVFEKNAKAEKFLAETVRKEDVVVTHHVPTNRSTAPGYRGSPLNPFFVCELDSLIEECQPAIWIHGHQHSSADYHIGPTRIVCNPFGYAGYAENRQFDWHKIIDL